MQRQRVSADYLQTSAVIDARRARALGRQRPERLRRAGHRLPARGRALGAPPGAAARRRPADARWASERDAEPIVVEGGEAATGDDPAEVVVAVGPAFADGDPPARSRTSTTATCWRRSARASGRAAATPRIVRVRRVADVAFIAHDGARLSGSGIALGIQSKGTAVIHRADLQPLDNLELFGMSPLYTLESLPRDGAERGRLRARPPRRARCRRELDNFARAKLIVRTTLLHARETQAVVPGARAVELELLAPVASDV